MVCEKIQWDLCTHFFVFLSLDKGLWEIQQLFLLLVWVKK